MTLQVWLKHERAPTSISEIPRKSSPQFLSIHEDHIPRLRVPTVSCTSTTVPLGGYTGTMEKKMETTIVYWGYIGIMEKKMETTICTSTLRMISSNLANPATGVGTQTLRVRIRTQSALQSGRHSRDPYTQDPATWKWKKRPCLSRWQEGTSLRSALQMG